MILKLGSKKQELKRLEITEDMFTEGVERSQILTDETTGEIKSNITAAYTALNLPFNVDKVVALNLFGTCRKTGGLSWDGDACVTFYPNWFYDIGELEANVGITAVESNTHNLAGYVTRQYINDDKVYVLEDYAVNCYGGGERRTRITATAQTLVANISGGTIKQLLFPESFFSTYFSFPGTDGSASYVYYLD